MSTGVKLIYVPLSLVDCSLSVYEADLLSVDESEHAWDGDFQYPIEY